MRIDFAQFSFSNPHPSPLPGEIWEISRFLQSPLILEPGEERRLYSPQARQFLEGNSAPRYAIIVKEPEQKEDWTIVSIMLLSEQISFLSDVNILIPSVISGLEKDLLALTWLVEPMLTINLSRVVGKRLSREIYDILLTVGDYYHSLVKNPPTTQEIESLGLQVGIAESEEFHQQEKAWTDVLKVPLEAYRIYQRAMQWTEVIVEETLDLERELTSFSQTKISLSQWLENIFNTDWLSFSEFWQSRTPSFAVRNINEFKEVISDKIEMSLLSFLDEETLWKTIDNLWQTNSQLPISVKRRVKEVQLAGEKIALMVAIVERNSDYSILIRIYPISKMLLPANLTLILLDESEQILHEVIASQTDIYIQLKLSCQAGEEFKIKVSLQEESMIEEFII